MERDKRTPEFLHLNDYLTDRLSYSGRSERIKGLNKIASSIGEISNITTINPIILSEKLYGEYAKRQLSSPVIQNCTAEIWRRLQGDKYPLIVRRLFPDQKGNAKTGPRSGNVGSINDLSTEIGKFYEYFSAKYKTNQVAPEIMVHRVVDTGNPPLREDPFLPHPGGDVTPIGNHTYLIRATWGADESVQGFPCDKWTVKFDPDGSVFMSPPIRELKTRSVVPAPEKYRRIDIPKDAQDILPLEDLQVLTLAKVAKNLEDQNGGHRLEFDETIINDKNNLVVIEATPFEKYSNIHENLRPFGENIVRPLKLITSGADIQNLPSGDLAIVRLPPEMFQGNELRQTLMDLALTAKINKVSLAALVAGDDATQHAIRDIIDNGHAVWFTDNEQFQSGENIRLFKTTGGSYGWERENPIAYQEQTQGRGVERIGGKAIGLHKLEEYGFKTASYFVIETSLFRRVIEDLKINISMAKLDKLSPTAGLDEIAYSTNNIMKKIKNYTGNQIPDLEMALNKIGGDLFSVRSSAKLEDRRISLAGYFDTRLNVRKQDLPGAVLEILASAVKPLAVKSALGMDLRPSEAAMAVVIQKMVKAQAAGTIFTKKHLTGDENVLMIEATKGLGNKVVDGTAKDKQQISVRKKTGKITENIVHGARPVLNENQIIQLSELGIAVETALDEGFQDIEWAIDENNEIVLLQARPL